METAFQNGAGSIIVTNPFNPGGYVFTESQLDEVCALARKYNARVIVDEIHAPLVRPGARFTSVLSLDEGAEALVSISPAKGYNLAGLKAGAVLAGPERAQAVADR